MLTHALERVALKMKFANQLALVSEAGRVTGKVRIGERHSGEEFGEVGIERPFSAGASDEAFDGAECYGAARSGEEQLVWPFHEMESGGLFASGEHLKNVDGP